MPQRTGLARHDDPLCPRYRAGRSIWMAWRSGSALTASWRRPLEHETDHLDGVAYIDRVEEIDDMFPLPFANRGGR